MSAKENNSGALYNGQISQADAGGIRYSSKLMTALNQFTGGLSTSVTNPMRDRYGEAYEYLVSGDALRFKEDVDTAIEHYKYALSLHEELTEALVGIGKCLRRKGDAMGAVRYFQKALQRNAFQKELQLDVAKCYTECGYINKAISHYKRAIKLDPTFIEAIFGLALVVEINGDNQQAIGYYQQIVEIDAEFLPAYNNLGSLYMRLAMYGQAEALFQQLIEKAPDFSRGYLGLAITLDKSGKKKESLATYHKVLSMKPNSRNSEFIERRIVQLSKELGRCRSSATTTLVRIK